MSFIPSLVSLSGHSLPYHLAAERAAISLGWQFTGIVRTDCQIAPAHWHRRLAPMRSHTARPQPAHRLPAAFHSYAAALQEYQQPGSVVFLEQFDLAELVATCVACARHLNNTSSFWLMYRHDISTIRTAAFHKGISQAMARRLGRRFLLLTDSEPLANCLSGYFNLPFHVLPIPHSHSDAPAPAMDERPGITLRAYAPGRVALEKGSDIIATLANRPVEDPPAIELVSHNRSLVQMFDGPKLIALPDALPGPDYWQELHMADLVLLPYTHPRYRMSTSGILLEAIVAGKKPVVMEGTWMANELRKFGLDNLILPDNVWRSDKIWMRLAQLSSDPMIADKLFAMQAHYQRTHCESNFAARLCELHFQSHAV